MTKPALRVFDAALAQQWAIEERALRALFEVAAREPGPALEALAARVDRPLDNTERTTVRDGVAMIPVKGPLFRYANIFTELSGATSIGVLATDFAQAVADPRVRSIVLVVDSPGGEVNGVAEMAQQIVAARGTKPIVAYVGHLGASGAYWIAAAADRVYIAPTAIVGSVGAVLTVRDTRKAEEARGIKTLEFVSAVSPGKRRDPTTDEGAAAMQAVVDRLGEEFVAAVAAMRGVATDKVLTDFGQGGVLVGRDAVTAGMADGVSTLEQVIVSVSPSSVRSHRMSDVKTAADLKAAYPQLVAEIVKVAETAALETISTDIVSQVAAARVDGAKAERERILGIEALTAKGHEKLIATLKADGKTTAAEAALAIHQADQAAQAAVLAGLKSDGQAGPAPAPGARPAAPAVLTPQAAAQAIGKEIADAATRGETLSVAQAGARVRARTRVPAAAA